METKIEEKNIDVPVKAAWSRKIGDYLYVDHDGKISTVTPTTTFFGNQDDWDNTLNYSIQAVVNRIIKIEDGYNPGTFTFKEEEIEIDGQKMLVNHCVDELDIQISTSEWNHEIIDKKYNQTNISTNPSEIFIRINKNGKFLKTWGYIKILNHWGYTFSKKESEPNLMDPNSVSV